MRHTREIVATTAQPADRGVASGGRGRAVGQLAPRRQLYLDNLKVILIAAVIAIHGVLSYAGFLQVWTYAELREVTLAPVTEAVLLVLVSPFGLCTMTLLFLVAGLLTPPSLRRKGTGRFVRDRLLRLGVPFTAYVLLVQPTLVYALEHPLGAAPRSFWYEFLGEERVLDTGPLWFVGVLLIFSLAHAAWVQARADHAPRREPGPLSARHVTLIAAAVVPTSFLIRLVYPYGSDSGFTDLNLWQWPACAALFAIGITASRHGWLTTVPDALHRRCRTVTLAAAGALAGFLLVVGGLDRVEDMLGSWHWSALGFATIEGTLAVFGPVWLLGAAQRHLNRPLRWAAPAVSRSAYAAFILQTFVLLGLAVALRPLSVPAELKAILVATGGVTGSFALAWLLISRVPGLARIL